MKRQKTTIRRIVSDALASIAESELRELLKRSIIEPYTQKREFEDEHGRMKKDAVWIVARTPSDNVLVAFSEGGYSKLGLRWGLVFVKTDDFGDSSAWYPSLEELAKDCGYF